MQPSKADILVHCYFSPTAVGGNLLCCLCSDHVVAFFFKNAWTSISRLQLLKLLLLETEMALPPNQVPPPFFSHQKILNTALQKKKKLLVQFLTTNKCKTYASHMGNAPKGKSLQLDLSICSIRENKNSFSH